MQFFKNPFYIYIISFLTVVLIYQLGWSNLYPKLSILLLFFFLGTFIISLCFGAIIDKYKPIKYFRIVNSKNSGLVIIIIYFLFILEFINNKGIPLILVFTTEWYEYTSFGIKTLHPVLVTFTSFYSVYLFHSLLSNKSLKGVVYLVLLMIIPFLIYNRGMFLINLVSILFVYLMSVRSVRNKIKLFIFLGLFFILYLFGILGNYRMTKSVTSDYFVEVSQTTNSFKESIIPNEFMWTYIYMSSPLGNLQKTIEKNPKINYRIKDFIFTELVPDFLSKRISSIVSSKRVEKLNRLTTFMTVGTIYSRSYILLGWLGLILMFAFLMIATFIYILIIPKNSPYFVTGISILCSFMFFNTFTNMIYFSGISFQLLFPLLFSIKFKFSKND